jgi:hypothetical protein
MAEPVVLPKFELPGDRPHWVVRAAWITGGLLLLSVVGLGAVIVHHRNLETQAHLAKIEAIAKVKAERDAKIAAVAAAEASARAQKQAEIAAKVAAQTMPVTTVPAPGDLGDVATPGKLAKRGHVHRSHGTHGAKGIAARSEGRSAVSKSDAPDDLSRKKAGRSPSSSKPDPIDELLRKMK